MRSPSRIRRLSKHQMKLREPNSSRRSVTADLLLLIAFCGFA
jgi:hypothetical protein